MGQRIRGSAVERWTGRTLRLSLSGVFLCLALSAGQAVAQTGAVPSPGILPSSALVGGAIPSPGAVGDLYRNAPGSTSVATFFGGDVGEGLDLDGDVVLAVNLAGPGGFSIRDAHFTDEASADADVYAEHEHTWPAPTFGATSGDNALETVMRSIVWSSYPTDLAVEADLVPGQLYKLQLLFWEGCCNRAFDVEIEGQVVQTALNVGNVQGGAGQRTHGVVVTHTFRSSDDWLDVRLGGTNTPAPDDNPILAGFTLEAIGAPASSVNQLQNELLQNQLLKSQLQFLLMSDIAKALFEQQLQIMRNIGG
ncbi:MAG: hypothetical protein MJE66_08355 [Proteobacteria bacterium]|nr:hypothetical protein [Pseudomonadota bacterium]